jgi:HlyD family secretion protein
LRAPQAGTVHELTAHTIGGVIGESETIMQIVPGADELVVEAKVAPQDIDQVTSGAEAVVRIMAGNQRTTPVITGSVARVSADITREQQNSNQSAQAYYTVRIALPADELARLHDIRLVPGMPAEVFIQTHERNSSHFASRSHARSASDDGVRRYIFQAKTVRASAKYQLNFDTALR